MIINNNLYDIESSTLNQDKLIKESVASLAKMYFPEFNPLYSQTSELSIEAADLFAERIFVDFLLKLDKEDTALDSDEGLDGTRKDFPILSEKVNGHPLVWFDNAATTQKPQCVIDRIKSFYEHENSNVHRGAHSLARRTTDAYEDARAKAGAFLNASTTQEIVFVRGTTEAINLAAHSYGLPHLHDGDEVLITQLEHHANIVPWQIVCAKTGAKLKASPVNEHGQVDMAAFEKLLSNKTKLVAITHVSNAIGTVTPVAQMIQIAHQYGARVFVDGAQAVAHQAIDVQVLDCDFYAFSGHKVFGPTGIGVLYAKSELLEEMPPYQGGGSMIEDVSLESTKYKAPPHRFEAGTGNIAGAIGLGAALDYVRHVGLNRIEQYEKRLLLHACDSLKGVPGLKIIGKPQAGIVSFLLNGVSPEEVGKHLDQQGIAVRAGHHCAQPILRYLGYESTLRVSLALYNTRSEIDRLVNALKNIGRATSYWSFPPIPQVMPD